MDRDLRNLVHICKHVWDTSILFLLKKYFTLIYRLAIFFMQVDCMKKLIKINEDISIVNEARLEFISNYTLFAKNYIKYSNTWNYLFEL